VKTSELISLAGRLIRAKVMGRRIPFQMHIRVIDRCNLRCSYCFGDYPVRDLPPPGTGRLLDLIDGLAHLGTKRVTLTGGEPLLRDDIREVVGRARSHRIEVSLTTNGILIDRFPELPSELSQLTVSLDGSREAHDAFRGDGSWEAAVHAVEVARKAGAAVQLLATVTRLSAPGLRDVFEIAERFDCSVTFDLVAPRYQPDGSLAPRPESPGDEKIRDLLDSLIRENNPRGVFSASVLEYLRRWPDGYARYRLFHSEVPPRFKPLPCSAGRFFAIIETDGGLYPCCRIGPQYDAPNVYELGVEEAWRRMPPHDCAACVQVGSNMFNAFFAPDIPTCLHLLRIQKMGREKR